MPTLNAAGYISQFVGGLNRQVRQPDRVIILDSASTDGSPQLWREQGLEVVSIPRGTFDHGGTRNLGARLAGEGICCFLTQDAVMASPQTLAALIEPLEKGQAAATFGRQLPRPEASPAERYARYFQYRAASECRSAQDVPGLGVRAYRFTNVCSAVRLEKFWAVGGFPERIILNEDMLLVARLFAAGERVCYVGAAEVLHSHDYTLKQQFQRHFDIGASFADAAELLRGARVGGEGVRFAVGQMGYLVRLGEWRQVPAAVGDLGARMLGFQLGRRHQALPTPLKKKLSMHSYHWDQKEQR
ncbi:glycosyltransferase family 2 protein [Deinococcus terrestris]|uniref:glycosyltransferase family 2 protein n=1 Tax=Deinococcus terrestris TaxID=2651870 RepID=UPI0018846789